MRKNILILVFSVVLLSLLNTRTSFMSSNNTDSTNYINLPEFPISFNADISFIELATNFVSQINGAQRHR